ncbi:MAG: hypothetical protein ACSLE6_20795 [Mycobacterium sp.]
MDVEILVVPDCPNEQPAIELLGRALADAGHPSEIRISVIRTAKEAERRGFRGSPSFIVNGTDLFPAGDLGSAMACRIYPTRTGLHGLPSRDDLMNAITKVLAHCEGQQRAMQGDNRFRED